MEEKKDNDLMAFFLLKTNSQIRYALNNNEYTEQFEKLSQFYAPSEELKQLIEDNKKLLFWGPDHDCSDKNFDALQHFDVTNKFGSRAKIPGIIFKSDQVKRIINAELMRRYIDENNLNYVAVALKYFHKVTYNNETAQLVSAEKVNHTVKEGFVITLAAIQQLVQLAEYCGFTDWGTWDKEKKRSKNIVVNDNDVMVFIDTSDESFKYKTFFNKEVSDKEKRLVCQELLKAFESGMEDEAREWLEQRIKQYQ